MLPSLAGQHGVELELIVVDNASTDGSVEIALEHFPSATVVRNPANRGFAAAANQGVLRCSSDFIFFINPDVRLEPGFVSNIVEVMERDETIALAGGMLLRANAELEPTGEIDSLGIRMTRSGRHLDLHQGSKLGSTTLEPFEVFGVSGAAMVARRRFLDDAAVEGEYFDERFFAYREDADLSWRAQLLGWKCVTVPVAVAYHVRRVTPAARRSLPPSINMHSVKNRFLLRLNNEGAFLALRNLPFELFRDAVVVVAVLARERTSLPALSYLIRERAAIVRRRRAIQRRRRVGDRVIARWFR